MQVGDRGASNREGVLTRRRFLRSTGLAAAATVLAGRGAFARPVSAEEEVVLTDTVFGTGMYRYLPFEVPAGVNRVSVAMTKMGDAALGIGLFDQRGPGYQSRGFRGIYGEERSAFFVAADSASQSFLPGPIEAGTWTVIVPVFRAPAPTPITVRIVLGYGPQPMGKKPGREQGVVRDEAGWYRGDLHCHTPESSDAFNSGTAFTPAEWADEARRIGLDYAAMTDHNVVSQNLDLKAAAGKGVLLMPGEEMTNWFHGHATVSGIDVGAWLDWRQRPAGIEVGPNEARIQDFIAVVEEMGAFVSAAHPFGPSVGLPWTFFAEAEADPAARTHSIEVWTGNFQPDDEVALRSWDTMLQQGMRIFANGGSDLHARDDTRFRYQAGTPTTVVYAERLEKQALVAALRAGRSFVTRLPDGVEAYLTATGVDGQRTFVGGTIFGAPTDTAEVEVLVRRAGGMRLVLWANGAPVSVTPLTSDEQVVSASVPIGPGGYVRAEVRSEPVFFSDAPLASRLDMEAFTNPIFLVVGAPPVGSQPETAPPSGGAVEPAPPPPGSSIVGTSEEARNLPATGGSALLVAGGAAAALGAAARVTLTELRWRAASGAGAGLDRDVELVGQVDDRLADGSLVLGRSVPGRCCGRHDEQVHVEVSGISEDAVDIGDWLVVVARWEPGSAAEPGAPPRCTASSWALLADPPERHEL